MTNNVVQLKEAFNAFEDAIYIINSDYTIKYMNKAMIRLFGDGKGMKCYDLELHKTKLIPGKYLSQP
ncbi:MAG: hypothetical protein B6I31_04240 [Desulfobacteraceae bacterium 4572_19]|nr:MAG: hypothetical protein B6I31_04240 [Desulfobacteraceae bacterium 4572_19]